MAHSPKSPRNSLGGRNRSTLSPFASQFNTTGSIQRNSDPPSGISCSDTCLLDLSIIYLLAQGQTAVVTEGAISLRANGDWWVMV
jgi:hypothetical protein